MPAGRPLADERTCRVCGKKKAIQLFAHNGRSYLRKCRDCHNAERRQRRHGDEPVPYPTFRRSASEMLARVWWVGFAAELRERLAESGERKVG